VWPRSSHRLQAVVPPLASAETPALTKSALKEAKEHRARCVLFSSTGTAMESDTCQNDRNALSCLPPPPPPYCQSRLVPTMQMTTRSDRAPPCQPNDGCPNSSIRPESHGNDGFLLDYRSSRVTIRTLAHDTAPRARPIRDEFTGSNDSLSNANRCYRSCAMTAPLLLRTDFGPNIALGIPTSGDMQNVQCCRTIVRYTAICNTFIIKITVYWPAGTCTTAHASFFASMHSDSNL
jgi:hypothetical protein